MQTRSEEVSYVSLSGALSIAAYIVGTPSNAVTRSRSMISRALLALKRGINDSVAPAATAAFIAQTCPNAWKSGSAPSTTERASKPNRSSATSTFRPRFAWVSSEPFGLPAVPDVYRITAVSSPSRSITLGFSSAEDSSRSYAPGVTPTASAPLAASLTPARPAPLLDGDCHRVQANPEPSLGGCEVELVVSRLEQRVHR